MTFLCRRCGINPVQIKDTLCEPCRRATKVANSRKAASTRKRMRSWGVSNSPAPVLDTVAAGELGRAPVKS